MQLDCVLLLDKTEMHVLDGTNRVAILFKKLVAFELLLPKRAIIRERNYFTVRLRHI